MYEFFPDVPPQTKTLAPPLYTVYMYTVYLSVATCAPPPNFYVADPMFKHIKVVRI